MSDPDQIKDSKNLYNISPGEIFWRNFLAGVSRGLGGMVVYFLVILVLSGIIYQLVWPTIGPSIEGLGESTAVLKQIYGIQDASSVKN